MNRYYFTATVRRDGSSRFEDHWGTFPSFAFAWKINEENNLKEGIDNYIYYVQYMQSGPYGNYPLVGEDGKFYTPKYFNKNLKWETTTTYNIGLDWGILNQRLSGTVDWYYRKTKDLINRAPVGALMGFADEGLQNIGSLSNMGVEAAVNWRVIQTKDSYWTMSDNFITGRKASPHR